MSIFSERLSAKFKSITFWPRMLNIATLVNGSVFEFIVTNSLAGLGAIIKSEIELSLVPKRWSLTINRPLLISLITIFPLAKYGYTLHAPSKLAELLPG